MRENYLFKFNLHSVLLIILMNGSANFDFIHGRILEVNNAIGYAC